MNDLVKSKGLLWSLAISFTVIILAMLGVRTLVPPDEGRYAEIAREMFATGDWITTRLNGIKYFEKPPLQTWMNALSFAVFGLGDWQARLWTGVSGVIGVLMTGYAGTRVFNPRIGWYAAMVLGSCFYWVASAQTNSLDMGLSGMMTLALGALLIAQRDQASAAERRNWMLVCWAAMALSVLSKGLIGLVLPGAVLVLYTVVARDWRIWQRLHLVKGLLLFFAVAAPWFVLVGLNNPEQPHFFFIHEHFERFLLKTHRREGPWYTFLVLLVPFIMPWLGALPHSLTQAVRRDHGTFQPRLMLLIWAGFILFFFSYSNSKLPGYILPIFPALALLIGAYLENASRHCRAATAILSALAGLALVVAGCLLTTLVRAHPNEGPLLQAAQPWVVAAGFVAFVGGVAALLHARHMRRDLMVLTLAASGLIATELIATGYETYGRHRAGAALVPAINAELTPTTTIYSVGTYEQSLPFYLGRTMVLVDYRDEFSFGLRQEPGLSIPTQDAFELEWRAKAKTGMRAVAIMNPERYQELTRRNLPMRVITRDTRRVVVATL